MLTSWMEGLQLHFLLASLREGGWRYLNYKPDFSEYLFYLITLLFLRIFEATG